MTRYVFPGIFSGVCLMIFCMIGCGGPPRPADLPSLHPVLLTFTQEGEPLVGAMVMLYSDSPDFKWSVAAITDANGTATLKTHAQFSGVPAGTYKIVVTKSEQPEAIAVASPDGSTPKRDPNAKKIVLYRLLEKQFTDLATTPLSLSVEKRRNVQTFDLGKKVREIGDTVEL